MPSHYVYFPMVKFSGAKCNYYNNLRRQTGMLRLILKYTIGGRMAVSKYDSLWKHLYNSGNDHIKLSFDEIQKIIGVEIDHSFLNYKKEAKKYGYQVGRISLKEKNVVFTKIDNPENYA